MVSPRQVLILAVAALLVWRIGAVGMSSHYAQAIIEGEPEAVNKALVWDNRQPEAVYRQAIALRDEDPEVAAALLVRANAQDMGDARPFFAAADTALAQGDQARADALVETALRLRPVDPRIRQRAGWYWISRGDVKQAIRHWSHALEASNGTRRELFPLLLKLAEDPRTRSAYETLAASPPSWWDAFFSEVAERASKTDAVRELYSLRRQPWHAPITLSERKSYVARLKKDGLTAQAYIAWTKGLASAQEKSQGLLYNGSFEFEPTNWGFGWHIRPSHGVLIERVYTYGSDQDKALHLIFNRHQARLNGPYQALFLNAGTYRLSGRVRTENLDIDNEKGIKWVVRCLLPQQEELGESERFLGANEWRDFGFEFRVPDTCTLQEIRLVKVGERPREREVAGTAWFDGMAIRKRPQPNKIPSTSVHNP